MGTRAPESPSARRSEACVEHCKGDRGRKPRAVRLSLTFDLIFSYSFSGGGGGREERGGGGGRGGGGREGGGGRRGEEGGEGRRGGEGGEGGEGRGGEGGGAVGMASGSCLVERF